MNKKLQYSAFIIFCTLGASIPFFIKADIFEELFKNVDFNKLAEDMETMFGKEAMQGDAPKMDPIAQKTDTPPMEKVIQTTSSDQPKDTRALFINPDMQTIQAKEKTRTEPTKKSRESLVKFKQDMDENLNTLVLNIESNKNLSPQFKEKYLPILKEAADKITIANELIVSKKMYQKIFLSPPAVQTSSYSSPDAEKFKSKPISDLMKELRQRYLSLIDKIYALNKKVTVSEKEESEEDKEKLEEFAKQQMQEVPHSEELTPIKPKIRGPKPNKTDEEEQQ